MVNQLCDYKAATLQTADLMGGDFFIISVVLLPVICAHLVAGKLYTVHLAGLICFAGIAFLFMLLLLNDEFPFSSAGDDENYFDASQRSFTSLDDWFDMTQYDHEQTGYPLLLSWVHQVSGDSLYHLKALNVFFLLEIALVWFAIGMLIGGRRLAFIYAYGMLLATPLWYYWAFLLKDMAITLVQSIFLLGLILFVSGEHRFRGCAVIALSTLAVIPLRSMLALLNVGLLVACTVPMGRSRTGGARSGTRLAVVASLVVGLSLLSSQPGMMATLGVKGEDRALTAKGLETQLERAERDRQSFAYSYLMFPVLYLVGETAAFNPDNWSQFDVDQLRPLSMVPWILLGPPFFLAGVRMMLRRTRPWKVFASGLQHNDDLPAGEDLGQGQTSSLWILLVFIVAYAALGWLSGTTVRFTLPAIPAMVGIAGFAWANMNSHARIRLLTAFDFSFLTLILSYYLVLK